jgi:polysaccharide biosynthesis/export protein
MCKVKSRSFAFALLAGIVTAGGMVVMGQTKPDAVRPPNPPAPNPAGTSEPSPAAVDPNKYLIGPEDVLYIRVWREPDFTGPVVVRPDGKITMPLIAEVQAGGLTPLQLTKSLTESLTKLINTPDVTVSVTDVRSKKYYIDGEVNRSGSFPLITPTTILEALTNASGFKEFSNPKKITILRGSNILKFNYKDVIKGKHMEQNVLIENGDHIHVP